MLKRVRARRRSASELRNDLDDRNLRLVMAAMLRHDANCIDIGANAGAMVADILHFAPAGDHIAVEPIPTLAQALRDRFPAVRVEAVALSDAPGETTFNVATEAPGLSGFKQRNWMSGSWEQIRVPVTTVDSIVPAGHRVDFVKIDVEGAHILALRGARRVLTESKPFIWLDHGARSAEHYGTTSEDLWRLLVDEHGYRLFTADGEGPLAWPEFKATDDAPLCTFMAHD